MSALNARAADAIVISALLGALAVPGFACAPFSHGAGDRPDGDRLVTGSITVPAAAQLGREVTGLQIAAVSIALDANSAPVARVFPSSVFDASHDETVSFTTPIPENVSFVLILQVPSASTIGPGTFLAALHVDDGFGETELLPPGAADIDLAAVTVTTGARAADATLVVGDGNNPLAQVDTDKDGVPDLTDDDDDGDGTPDASDSDVGGDGIDDSLQVLPALPDSDGDGIPDLLQPT